MEGVSVENITVPVATGDDYCAEHGVDRIAMLKIDVEGMEYEVLAGFQRMLAEHRIGVI